MPGQRRRRNQKCFSAHAVDVDHDAKHPFRGGVVLRELRHGRWGSKADASSSDTSIFGRFFLHKLLFVTQDHLVCWIRHETHTGPKIEATDRIVVLDRLTPEHRLSSQQEAALVQLALRPRASASADILEDANAAATAAAASAQVPVLICRFSSSNPLTSIDFFPYPLTLVAARADGTTLFWQWDSASKVWTLVATVNLVQGLLVDPLPDDAQLKLVSIAATRTPARSSSNMSTRFTWQVAQTSGGSRSQTRVWILACTIQLAAMPSHHSHSERKVGNIVEFSSATVVHSSTCVDFFNILTLGGSSEKKMASSQNAGSCIILLPRDSHSDGIRVWSFRDRCFLGHVEGRCDICQCSPCLHMCDSQTACTSATTADSVPLLSAQCPVSGKVVLVHPTRGTVELLEVRSAQRSLNAEPCLVRTSVCTIRASAGLELSSDPGQVIVLAGDTILLQTQTKSIFVIDFPSGVCLDVLHSKKGCNPTEVQMLWSGVRMDGMRQRAITGIASESRVCRLYLGFRAGRVDALLSSVDRHIDTAVKLGAESNFIPLRNSIDHHSIKSVLTRVADILSTCGRANNQKYIARLQQRLKATELTVAHLTRDTKSIAAPNSFEEASEALPAFNENAAQMLALASIPDAYGVHEIQANIRQFSNSLSSSPPSPSSSSPKSDMIPNSTSQLPQLWQDFTPLSVSLQSYRQLCVDKFGADPGSINGVGERPGLPEDVGLPIDFCVRDPHGGIRIFGMRFAANLRLEALTVARLWAIYLLQNARNDVNGVFRVALLSFADELVKDMSQTLNSLLFTVFHALHTHTTDPKCLELSFPTLFTFCVIQYCLAPVEFGGMVVAAVDGTSHVTRQPPNCADNEIAVPVVPERGVHVVRMVRRLIGPVAVAAECPRHLGCHVHLALAAGQFDQAVHIAWVHGSKLKLKGLPKQDEAWRVALQLAQAIISLAPFSVTDDKSSLSFLNVSALVSGVLASAATSNEAGSKTNGDKISVSIPLQLSCAFDLIPSSWTLAGALRVVREVLQQNANVKLSMKDILPLIKRFRDERIDKTQRPDKSNLGR